MEQNGSQAPSTGPDFNQELAKAQENGDFDFVIRTAQSSRKMLIDFRDIVSRASYIGKECGSIAMGLNFLENMINTATGQLEALKRSAKATKEAIEATTPTPPASPETA